MSWMLIMVVENVIRIISNHKDNEKKQERLRKQSLVTILEKADNKKEKTEALTVMGCLDYYPHLELYTRCY
jgi:phosphopantothenate synthetase